jgi:ketosteroid isomerase-like protein
MRSTKDVFEHHLACFANSDLEGTLSDFTEQSVLMTPLGALRGLSEIRGFFETAYAEFGAPGTKFTAHQMLVDGDCAFIAWDAETSANKYEGASDTFIIRDGRIAVQTFSAKVTPKSA